MGADMTIAALDLKDTEHLTLDFDAARAMLEITTDPDVFDFYETGLDMRLENLLEDLPGAPDSLYDHEGEPTLEALLEAGRRILATLEENVPGDEIASMHIGGHALLISGGLSWGDAPTDAAQAIWDANTLPCTVLDALGVRVDEKP